MLGIVDPVIFILAVAGEYDPAEFGNNINDHIFIRMVDQIDLIDIPVIAVVLQDQIQHTFDLFVHGSHWHFPLCFFMVIA